MNNFTLVYLTIFLKGPEPFESLKLCETEAVQGLSSSVSTKMCESVLCRIQPRNFSSTSPLIDELSSESNLVPVGSNASAGNPMAKTSANKRSLLGKSTLERQKDVRDSEFHRVVSGILSHEDESKTGKALCLAQLSAVGQLFEFQLWRKAIVDMVLEHCGYDPSSTICILDSPAKDVRLSGENFSSLALLFNMAIEECDSENDFTNAKALLFLTAQIYRFDEGGVHRVYLNAVTKKHRLWENRGFWDFSFDDDMKIHTANKQLDAADAFGVEREAVSSTDMYQTETLCFDLTGKYIFTMLSLAIDISLAREFVVGVCSKYQTSEDKTQILEKLVDNIYKSSAAGGGSPKDTLSVFGELSVGES